MAMVGLAMAMIMSLLAMCLKVVIERWSQRDKEEVERKSMRVCWPWLRVVGYMVLGLGVLFIECQNSEDKPIVCTIKHKKR